MKPANDNARPWRKPAVPPTNISFELYCAVLLGAVPRTAVELNPPVPLRVVR